MTDQIQAKQTRPAYDIVRAAALQAIIRIEQGDQTDVALRSVMKQARFRPLDHRFIRQLVNGTTKMRKRLDFEIKFFLARPSTALSLKLANILRLGFYQLLFTDKVPDAAAVSETVNLAKQFLDQKQSKLVNAVMRAKLREPTKVIFPNQDTEPVAYLSVYYSYPEYFCEYCFNEFGFEETKIFLDEGNHAPKVTYRVNFLKAKPDEVANSLQTAGIEFSYGKYLPEFLNIHSGGLPLETELISSGKVFVQDESAGIPVRLLNPKPGSDVDRHLVNLALR